MQIGREGTEAAYWLRYAICPDGSHVHGRANVDGSCVRVHPWASCGRPWTSICCGSSPILLLTCGRAGLRNLFRFLNGIAGTASPLSSTQQPMDQVFFNGITCHQN